MAIGQWDLQGGSLNNNVSLNSGWKLDTFFEVRSTSEAQVAGCNFALLFPNLLMEWIIKYRYEIHVRGWAKKQAIGCMNSALCVQRLPGRGLAQPRARLFDHPRTCVSLIFALCVAEVVLYSRWDCTVVFIGIRRGTSLLRICSQKVICVLLKTVQRIQLPYNFERTDSLGVAWYPVSGGLAEPRT